MIGGRDEERDMAYQVYKKFISNLHLVSSAKVAEIIKVMEGCYRDVNIALANELFKICQDRVSIFSRQEIRPTTSSATFTCLTGVGGHCIPVYPWFLIKEIEKREHFCNCRLLCVSREVNDEMIRYWAERILLECMKMNKPLFSIKICIKGITFRAGSRSLYHSRNLALARLLMEKGLDTYVYDPLLSEQDVQRKGLRYIEPLKADLLFDPFQLKFEYPN